MELINNYQVPEGYKKTEVGVIPEDWKIEELSSIGKFKNGINKSSKDFGHGSPFVNLMDVFGIRSISEVEHLGLVHSNDAEKNVYNLKEGDVIFIRSSVKPSGVGLTTVITRDLPDTVYSGFLIRFRDNGTLETDFKKYCFAEEKFRRNVIANSTVSANTNINQDSLKKLALAYPKSSKEQKAIAQTLSDVDALIAALDKLIAKKRNIKTATMQQLLTGKTRLPGFAEGKGYKKTEVGVIPEDWEVRELGSLATIQRGASPRPINSPIWYDSKSAVGWVRISDITNSDGKNLKVTQDYLSKQGISQSRYLPIGSLIMSICATVGIPVITRIESCIHDGFVGFSNLQDIDQEFLYYKLKDLETYFKSKGQTGSQSNLNSDIVRFCVIPLPHITEQKAIAQVLSDMDKEITALEKRRAKTQAIKQGMMQELLTGRTRLINN